MEKGKSMNQLDYTLLFIFPIIFGVMALGVAFLSASYPTELAQVTPDILVSIKEFQKQTAITIGVLAGLQLIAGFYLATKMGKQ
jgi:hypothetical protein